MKKLKQRPPRTIPRVAKHDAQCRFCGCTEGAACRGGCFWVTPDLCSACAQPFIAGQLQLCGQIMQMVEHMDDAGVIVTEKLLDDLVTVGLTLGEQAAQVGAPPIPDAWAPADEPAAAPVREPGKGFRSADLMMQSAGGGA